MGPEIHAVQKATFEIEKESFTSIVGESGSGKTVTALSICRLLLSAKVSGRVLFTPGQGDALDLMSISEERMTRLRGKEIAYVFQDPGSSLNPVIRVGRQIEEVYLAHVWPSSRTQATRRAEELLGSVKIQSPSRVMRSFPHELSGGMKQRALLAMALAAGPKLLIADEPTTALDVQTESEIMRLIQDFRKEYGLTVFFITHNLALASRHSDAIVVMKKGRIVERMEKKGAGFVPLEDYTKKLFLAEIGRVEPKTLIPI
jgi:ABC-type dipeptide/oligopeptide/nickel transport system ATPase component